MGFGATPKDSAGIPISSVYIPDVGFIALQGSPNTNTDGSLNESTAALLALGASSYASGTLQNAQTGSAAGTPLNVLGMASVVFTVNMVGFTGTVTFKASEDGTNYDALNVTQAGTSTISTTAVGSTTTSIHCYDASIAGYQFVEAVTSGVSAGNVTVTAHAIPINIAPRVVNIAGSITATNPSVGTDGSAIPTSSTLVGASDGTNLQQLLVESASNRNLRVGIYNGANEVAVDASGRLTLVPNQGVEIVDSGGTNKLAVDSSGRLTILSIANALPAGSNLIGTVELADSGGTNKLAIDSSGRITLVPNQTVEIVDSAGTNKLAVDSSGRLTLIPNSSVNIAQWNGAVPSVTNPVITEDQIRGYVANGNVFTCSTGKITAAANQAASWFSANTSAKNKLILSVRITSNNANQVTEFRYITADDTNITAGTSDIGNVINHKGGGAASEAATAMHHASAVTAPSVGASTLPLDVVEIQSSNTIELMTPGLPLYIPAGTAGGVAMYTGTTAAGQWSATVRWIEF